MKNAVGRSTTIASTWPLDSASLASSLVLNTAAGVVGVITLLIAS